MSDRVKLMLASLTVMMLPHRLGYSLTVLVLTAIMSTAIDLAKATFGRDAGVLEFHLRPFLSRGKIAFIMAVHCKRMV
jgi:hypothetical protein